VFAVAETPSVLRTSLWKGWSNTYKITYKRLSLRHSEQRERKAGVGGTNLHQPRYVLIAKYNLLILKDLYFEIP
jgi:hypothetical protein